MAKAHACALLFNIFNELTIQQEVKQETALAVGTRIHEEVKQCKQREAAPVC